MKLSQMAPVFLVAGLFFLADSATANVYVRKAYECTIEATQQDIFTEAEPLPCQDRVQFAQIRDNQSAKPILDGFFYAADSSCPTKLDASFFNHLWRHAEVKQANNHPYSHVLQVPLDRALTIKLLQHLGSTKIESSDDLPPLEIALNSGAPEIRQTHLPHQSKNGLSFHGIYKCKEIPFNVNLVGRPQVSPSLVLRGDKALKFGLGKAPNWAQQVRVALKGRDQSFSVSDVITANIDPNLPLGVHRLDVAYTRADGSLGPVRILDFSIVPIPAPQLVDKEMKLAKTAKSAVIKFKGKHPEWAAKIQSSSYGKSAEHPLDATINVSLSGYSGQIFELRYITADGRVGEMETVKINLY